MQAPSAPAMGGDSTPQWAQGLTGYKPGDKKVTIVNQGPNQSTETFGYTDGKGDMVYRAANGNIVEDPAGKAGPYVIKHAGSPKKATSDLADFVSENGHAAQPKNSVAAGGVSEHGKGSGYMPYEHSPGLTAQPTFSEHGQGSKFITDNGPAANPHPKSDTPIPAWEEANLNAALPAVKVGSQLEPHGMGIAMRDSKDGKSEIVQMTDGTYESVNKTTGEVTGAGTWGDSHGGGVAKNGFGNPLLPTTSTQPPTTPSNTYDVGGTLIRNGKAVADDALKPIPATTPPQISQSYDVGGTIVRPGQAIVDGIPGSTPAPAPPKTSIAPVNNTYDVGGDMFRNGKSVINAPEQPKPLVAAPISETSYLDRGADRGIDTAPASVATVTTGPTLPSTPQDLAVPPGVGAYDTTSAARGIPTPGHSFYE
jgi:hypothetical protein